MIVWLTGLSGSGKTTIAIHLQRELSALGIHCEVLDGDNLRQTICKDLGFSRSDRIENIKRIARIAQLLATHGILVVVAAITPFRAQRDELRRSIPGFFEVFVDAPLTVCEVRDPKGLYARARQGEIKLFTGIESDYEAPLHPECHCQTDRESPDESTQKVLELILCP